MQQRRTDNHLRSAINVLEGMYVSRPGIETILSRALQQLMLLFNANYGYVYRCSRQASNSTVPWELSKVFYRTPRGLSEAEAYSTSYKIPEDWLPNILAGRILRNHCPPVFREASFQPKKHPVIDNYLFIPVVDARQPHAMIMLCNLSYSKFDNNVEKRLRPFLAAVCCLIRTAIKNLEAKYMQPLALREPEDSYENIPEFLPKILEKQFNAVLILDEYDQILVANRVASELFAQPRKNLIGKSINQFLPRDSHKLQSRLGSENAEKLHGVSFTREDGKHMLLDLQHFAAEYQGQQIRGISLSDITNRNKSTSDYFNMLQRFQVLTTLAPIGIIQLDYDWQCIYVNDTWCEYCETTPDDSKGTGWIKGIHRDDLDPTLQLLRSSTMKTGSFQHEFRLQSPLGRVTWVKANACTLLDERGEHSGLIITFSDITSHRENEKRLREMAQTDQLTGLVNRYYFNDRLNQAIHGVSRYGALALMFIDLDEFKHINDTLGHDFGDHLLQQVASRFRNEIRDVDTIARLGGDEFTLLLSNIQNKHMINVIANKLIDTMSEPFVLGERSIFITCSVGITVCEDPREDPSILLKQADIALYRAKHLGRNQYNFFTPELDEIAHLHLQLRESLNQQPEDFHLVFQPQVNAANNEIIGMEALTRWQHPLGNQSSPGKFIKVIEDSGLLINFSDWLFNAAFGQLAQWQQEPSMKAAIPRLAINLSAKQFRDKTLPKIITDKARQFNLEPEDIVFEVTETALMEEPRVATAILKELKQLGFGLSLDDFGTGYSSLAYLRDLPIDTVKIEQSFIQRVLKSREDTDILAAILNLCQKLNLNTLAEGVETDAMQKWLMSHGCNQHQGFLYHKPMAAAEIEQLLNKHGQILYLAKG